MGKVSMRRIVEAGGEWLALTAIFCVAFALRYHFLTAYPHALMLHEQDGISYMGIARGIIEGQPLQSTFKPPFYPFAVAIFARLPVSLELAARLASVTMDALVVFPLYILARGVLSRSASFSAAVLWAFFSFSLFFSPSPLSLSTYLFFLLAGTSLLYLCHEKELSSGWLIPAGAFFAFSYLARPEGIAAFAVGAALSLMYLVRRGKSTKLKAVRFSIFIGGFFSFAAPYMVFLRNHLGYWTFTGKTQVALKGIDGSMTLQGAGMAGVKGSGLALWLEQYGGVAGVIVNTVRNFKGFMETFFATFPLWMFVIVLVGVIFLISRGGGGEKPLSGGSSACHGAGLHCKSSIRQFVPIPALSGIFHPVCSGYCGDCKGGTQVDRHCRYSRCRQGYGLCNGTVIAAFHRHCCLRFL